MQDEQRRAVAEAVLKVVGVAVVVGLVIGLGAFVMVKALGFSDSTPSAHSTSSAGSDSPSALPTVALSEPGASDETPAQSESASPTTEPKKKGIQLSATPVDVAPGGRINLTGRFTGQDNISLQVQRKEGGAWTKFADVQVTVRIGTFATYVLTSRTGANVFRVLDPITGKVSNAVTVTVG